MSFQTALSGLSAASSQLDITANNIANVSTTGFKESRASFADIFATAGNDISSLSTGAGVRLSNINQQFTQGNINLTGNNLDLAINGEGFFTMKGGAGVTYTRAGEFSVDPDGYIVNGNLDRLQVFPPSVSGNFVTGSYADLQIETGENPPNATASANIAVKLPASAEVPAVTTFDPTVSDSYNHATSLSIYDSLGASHNATLYFVKDAVVNSWQQFLYVDNNPVGGANPLGFDSLGNLTTPAGGEVSFPSYDPGNGASAMDLSFDFSDTTQFGAGFSVNALQQDGYATGRMTGIEISDTGVISARYTNGQSSDLGKIAVATFTNPGGLQQLGDTSWAETFVSGAARIGEAGVGSLGTIQDGALEGSNVDLTKQLVEMITAQRNFQANTKMISTSDELTQSIINMR